MAVREALLEGAESFKDRIWATGKWARTIQGMEDEGTAASRSHPQGDDHQARGRESRADTSAGRCGTASNQETGAAPTKHD